jgi:hypothetical protein
MLVIVRRVIEARRLHTSGSHPAFAQGQRAGKPVAASRTPALPPPSGVAFVDDDPTSEKPLTTIDPAVIRGRGQGRRGAGRFWRRLKCW